MSNTPVLRPRRSMSGTPSASGGTSITDTPVRNGLLHAHKINGRNITPGLSRSIADASFQNEDKVSPVLAMLRMTPGRLLKEKQSILVRKHEESKRKSDSINVGGGVSIWPEMVSMRMTSQDVWRLIGACLTLCVMVTLAFYILHERTLNLLSSQFTICKRDEILYLDQQQTRKKPLFINVYMFKISSMYAVPTQKRVKEGLDV